MFLFKSNATNKLLILSIDQLLYSTEVLPILEGAQVWFQIWYNELRTSLGRNCLFEISTDKTR